MESKKEETFQFFEISNLPIYQNAYMIASGILEKGSDKLTWKFYTSVIYNNKEVLLPYPTTSEITKEVPKDRINSEVDIFLNHGFLTQWRNKGIPDKREGQARPRKKLMSTSEFISNRETYPKLINIVREKTMNESLKQFLKRPILL